MPPLLLVSLVLALSTLAFWRGKQRAFALSTQASSVKMHSRPGYYGMLAALWCALPALAIVAVWQLAADSLLTRMAMDGVVAAKGALTPDQMNLLVNDMRNLVTGSVLDRQIDPLLQAAADRYTAMLNISHMALAVVALVTAAVAAYFVHARIKPSLRDRKITRLNSSHT